MGGSVGDSIGGSIGGTRLLSLPGKRILKPRWNPRAEGFEREGLCGSDGGDESSDVGAGHEEAAAVPNGTVGAHKDALGGGRADERLLVSAPSDARRTLTLETPSGHVWNARL